MPQPRVQHRIGVALGLAAAGLTAAASLAAPAHAATTGTVTVQRTGAVLSVTGGAEANRIGVSFQKASGFQGTWIVVDSTATLVAGEGCKTDSATQVSCAGDGLGDRLSVDAGEGDDQVTYTFGLPSTISGGAGADMLIGGFGADTINGGVGGDTIDGKDGNDTIRGSGDNDALDGGNGNDDIDGEGLDDTINGGPGSDTLTGAKGFDTIQGGSGDDQMLGNANSDTLIGDEGVDSADGGPLSGADGGIDRCDAETEIRCES